MTSKIFNNVISSRSEGDIAKLFWTCLFWPSAFLAKFFSSAVQHFFASTASWGVGFGLSFFFSFCIPIFLVLHGWCCSWFVLFTCALQISLISYAEQLIKISIWDQASSLEEACSMLGAL